MLKQSSGSIQKDQLGDSKSRFLRGRLFWTCDLIEGSDLWFYHVWTNWATGDYILVFAGYNIKSIIRKDTSWFTVQDKVNELLNERDGFNSNSSGRKQSPSSKSI